MNIKAVTVAVNYVDLLDYTWTRNKKELSSMCVVTDTEDRLTANFCEKNNLDIFRTDDFYKEESTFNKAAALNSFFANNIDPNKDEWILLLDSDIVLNNSISTIKEYFANKNLDSLVIPNDSSVGNGIPVYVGKNKKQPKIIYHNEPSLNEIHNCYDIHINDCLFSCSRHIYNTRKDYETNNSQHEKCFFYGYFQLFHVNKIADKLKSSENIFIENNDASVYDMVFARTYWSFHEKKTLNLSVDHLGPIGANWKGRLSNRW